jgi:hypothetical protein
VIDQAAQEALIPVEIELSADEFEAVERYVAEGVDRGAVIRRLPGLGLAPGPRDGCRAGCPVTALERARAAQARYLAHVRKAKRCDCAHGDLCPIGRGLDLDAGAAYYQAVGE